MATERWDASKHKFVRQGGTAARAAKAKATPIPANALSTTGITMRGADRTRERAQSAANSSRWNEYRAGEASRKAAGKSAADLKKLTSGKMTASQREGITSTFTKAQAERAETGRAATAERATTEREASAREFSSKTMTAAERGALGDAQKRTSLVERFGIAKETMDKSKLEFDREKASFEQRLSRSKFNLEARESAKYTDVDTGEVKWMSDHPGASLALGYTNAKDKKSFLETLTDEQRGYMSSFSQLEQSMMQGSQNGTQKGAPGRQSLMSVHEPTPPKTPSGYSNQAGKTPSRYSKQARKSVADIASSFTPGGGLSPATQSGSGFSPISQSEISQADAYKLSVIGGEYTPAGDPYTPQETRRLQDRAKVGEMARRTRGAEARWAPVMARAERQPINLGNRARGLLDALNIGTSQRDRYQTY